MKKPAKPTKKHESAIQEGLSNAYGGKTKEEAMRDSEARRQAPSLTKLQRTFREVCSNLAAYTSGAKVVVGNKVSVTLRDDGSYLAVLAYTDVDTFDSMVCFGSGETFEGALAGLSKALASGRVKPNKPWVPK